MTENANYPKRPFIGVDCSGQPKLPPLIAVATRWSRRERENKWVVQVTAKQINNYIAKGNWEEKLYAATIFRAIDKIIVPYYKIHVDKDFQQEKNLRKIRSYLERLFGSFHMGDPLLEKPDIFFCTRRCSEYVRHAHVKHGLVADGKMKIDEKAGPIDPMMKVLE